MVFALYSRIFWNYVCVTWSFPRSPFTFSLFTLYFMEVLRNFWQSCLLSYFELRSSGSSVLQHCFIIHYSASFGIMHQIPVGSSANPLFCFGVCFHPHGCSQQSQQTMCFSWPFHVLKGVCWFRSLERMQEYWHVLEMEMHMQQGLCEGLWTEMNCAHLCSSPYTWLCLFQILATALSLFPDCFDSSAVSPLFPAIIHVPSFCWFPLLPCLLIWGISTPNQGCLDESWRGCREQTGENAACLPLPTPRRRDSLHLLVTSRSAAVPLFWWHFLTKWEPTAEINATWCNLGSTSPSVKLTQSSSHHSSVLARGEWGKQDSDFAVRSSFTRREVCSLLIQYPIFLWLSLDVSSAHPSSSFPDPLQEDGSLPLLHCLFL